MLKWGARKIKEMSKFDNKFLEHYSKGFTWHCTLHPSNGWIEGYTTNSPIFCCLPVDLGDGLARKRTWEKSYLLQFKKCIFTSEVADSASARSPHPPPQGEPPKLAGASTTSPAQATSDKSSGSHWPQNSAAKHSLGSGEVLNHAADG